MLNHIKKNKGLALNPSVASSLGFTLIELLVVIAIIGILSTIGMTNLYSARLKARDAVRYSDIAQTRLLLELYYEEENSYYVSACADGEPTVAGWTGLMSTFETEEFIDDPFVDPKNTGSYIYKYCLHSSGKYRISYTTEKDDELHTIGY